jgi:hypothetical protein
VLTRGGGTGEGCEGRVVGDSLVCLLILANRLPMLPSNNSAKHETSNTKGSKNNQRKKEERTRNYENVTEKIESEKLRIKKKKQFAPQMNKQKESGHTRRLLIARFVLNQ